MAWRSFTLLQSDEDSLGAIGFADATHEVSQCLVECEEFACVIDTQAAKQSHVEFVLRSAQRVSPSWTSAGHCLLGVCVPANRIPGSEKNQHMLSLPEVDLGDERFVGQVFD